MKDLSTYGVKKLGFVIRLKHENGNGLRECPKTQAQSRKCENVQRNELNTFKRMFTLDMKFSRCFKLDIFNFFEKILKRGWLFGVHKFEVKGCEDEA
jgi:hypothetical protein